jgi:hypothetical protein
MSLHAAAQHLASKGRNGDTTLVHMTKGELVGLQALAKQHGTSMTINPHTGLPEAFSLKSLLPMAAGAALTIGSGGAIDPITAGMIVGGVTGVTSGSLTQGLTAGLGAYGGAGITGGVGAMGSAAGDQAAAAETEAAKQQAIEQQIAQQNAQQTALTSNPNMWDSVGAQASGAGTPVMTPEIAGEDAAQAANKVGMPTYGAPEGVNGTPFTPETQAKMADPYGTGFDKLTSKGGISSLNSTMASMDGPSLAKAGMYSAAPVVADALTPKPYTPPVINGDSDMGQRYSYNSGYDNSIPGRTSPASYTKISNDEAKKLYGYADGGNVQNPDEWVQDSQSVVRMADGGMFGGSIADAINKLKAQGAFGGEGSGGASDTGTGYTYGPKAKQYTANMATGGISDAHYNLGGYSDGGRLLKGPGDGVSDSIPAVIGSKQPARLADGEFVVPARIVSEIGNGSTEAGARKLYAMMDRVQKARGKTVGKGKVAKNTRADKFLPA